jgi:23S rRNA pseudouridine2605 synthase
VVKVSGKPLEDAIEKLRKGVSISTDDGKRVRTSPARIRIVKESENPWYEVTLIEGRNRQIRRMFEEVGHHVEKIKRVKYGPLALDVPPGEFRRLTLEEIAKLKNAIAAASSGTRPAPLEKPRRPKSQTVTREDRASNRPSSKRRFRRSA